VTVLDIIQQSQRDIQQDDIFRLKIALSVLTFLVLLLAFWVSSLHDRIYKLESRAAWFMPEGQAHVELYSEDVLNFPKEAQK
jgi:hypothetical protein